MYANLNWVGEAKVLVANNAVLAFLTKIHNLTHSKPAQYMTIRDSQQLVIT